MGGGVKRTTGDQLNTGFNSWLLLPGWPSKAWPDEDLTFSWNWLPCRGYGG